MLLVDQLVHFADELIQVDALVSDLSHAVAEFGTSVGVFVHQVHAAVQHKVIRLKHAIFLAAGVARLIDVVFITFIDLRERVQSELRLHLLLLAILRLVGF